MHVKLKVVIEEPEPLKDVMCKIFKKRYSDSDEQSKTMPIMADFEYRLSQLSLDNIERLATHYIERERQLYGESSYFLCEPNGQRTGREANIFNF